jgi:hypothetical protein
MSTVSNLQSMSPNEGEVFGNQKKRMGVVYTITRIRIRESNFCTFLGLVILEGQLVAVKNPIRYCCEIKRVDIYNGMQFKRYFLAMECQARYDEIYIAV